MAYKYLVVNASFANGAIAEGVINKDTGALVTCSWIIAPVLGHCNSTIDIDATFFRALHDVGVTYENEYVYLADCKYDPDFDIETNFCNAVIKAELM